METLNRIKGRKMKKNNESYEQFKNSFSTEG